VCLAGLIGGSRRVESFADRKGDKGRYDEALLTLLFYEVHFVIDVVGYPGLIPPFIRRNGDPV
jgi:hypothetical protein